MFITIFLSELKYVLKNYIIYVFLALFTLLVFSAMSSDHVVIGGAIGNIHRNSPYIITIYTTILSIFGLLMAANFFNNAALRDYSNNFNEILFSTPISKGGYFFGRFLAALILSTIPILGVFIGTYLATYIAPLAGWITPDRFGSLHWSTVINNYFLFILPNMFIAGAIIFALVNKWKNTMVSFIGIMLIIVAYIISGNLMSDIDNRQLAAVTDIFGIRAYGEYSRYFTPIEKNTLDPAFKGILLWNRLIWIGVGLIVLFIAYFNFSFKTKSKKARKQVADEREVEKVPMERPIVTALFTRETTWLQFKTFFGINFKNIVKSVTFKILFVFALLMLVGSLAGGFEYFGLKAYPVTYKMMDVIRNTSSIFLLIILVFFSGELIWRDRGVKINEVIDSTPHNSFISLAAKVVSLILATTMIYLFLVLCAIGYQLFNGFYRIEPGVYLLNFISNSFFSFVNLASLMILIQVIFKNKYVGYFVSIAFIFAISIVLQILDIQSNLVSPGEAPELIYSDMSGFGPGVLANFWFNLYWFLFSLICLFLAAVLWNRGTMRRFGEKLKTGFHEMPRRYMTVFGCIVAGWMLVGGWIFYNTQILNSYHSSKEQEKLQVYYEQHFKKYEHAPLPKITQVDYAIDIFPDQRNVEVKATLQLTNETDHPIDSLHFILDDDWKTRIEIPGARLAFYDKKTGYQIYKLTQAMQPGQQFLATITNQYLTKGFKNSYAGDHSVLSNGTFLNNFDILPMYGYSSDLEIADPNTRKKYKLPAKERMPKLEADCTTPCMANYLTNGLSDFINVTTTISTSADQTAVAPGSLVKQWKQNGRNYYKYVVDHPSQNFYSFMSARYEVAKRNWNGVSLEVYYDKKHSVNVPKMLNAIQGALEYYTQHFGPYYHKEARIIEFPRYSTFAQAFPGTMPYSESFGFVVDLSDTTKNNVVDAVVAHEMAHQWWAHQEVGANMQGATMLSESFAEYSSLMTMKHKTTDPMRMKQFLKYDYDRYLSGRSMEVEKELPLYKVENQSYIHYGKGSVVLFALQDYIGEDHLNTALRNFLDVYRYKNPPYYPTTLNFLSYLDPEVPDSMKYLINDWIKEITLYDLRMDQAKYKKLPDGKYEINLKVKASKVRADSLGKETQIPINDWIDLGLFSDKKGEKLMFQKRVKINQPEMSFSFVVDKLPEKASIDPRMLLIERHYKDNELPVEKMN